MQTHMQSSWRSCLLANTWLVGLALSGVNQRIIDECGRTWQNRLLFSDPALTHVISAFWQYPVCTKLVFVCSCSSLSVAFSRHWAKRCRCSNPSCWKLLWYDCYCSLSAGRLWLARRCVWLVWLIVAETKQ